MNDVLAIALAVVLLPLVWYKLAVYWNPPKPDPIAMLMTNFMAMGETIMMTSTAFEGLKAALQETEPVVRKFQGIYDEDFAAQFMGIPIIVNDNIGDLK